MGLVVRGQFSDFSSNVVVTPLSRWTLEAFSTASDYNVLLSKVIALNNFIQYSHCQVVQLFPLTSQKPSPQS